MFTSLRARLWLSYLLVSGLVLAVITAALLLYLVRNPRLAREAETNLATAANTLQRQGIPQGDRQELASYAQNADALLDMRVALITVQGEVMADSRADEGELPTLDHLLSRGPGAGGQGQGTGRIAEYTDANGQEWLFARRVLSSRFILLVATPRPTAPVLAVFTDELFQPIMQAALLALGLSLLLAFMIARWIAAPLQGITDASRSLGEGRMSQIEPRGPREVQDLAQAFNQMSSQVHASRQSQRDFVANVSHELKTPITSIQGFAQAILDGTAKGGESLSQAAQVIYNEAGRMHRLVLDLLDLARLDAGNVQLEYRAIDMGQLLYEVGERFVPQAKEAEVTLTNQVEEVPSISGDYDRLVQVFSNLVENALKFTPAGGEVRLSARRANGALLATVSDTGPGIHPEEAARIFERFYQVDKSRSGGRGRGAGLGLPIAQQIVQAHGGEIRVESQPGRGSAFVVRLPLSPST